MDGDNASTEKKPKLGAQVVWTKDGYSNVVLTSSLEESDITLHVGNKSIKAHKTVLASFSEYFKVLFDMDAKDKADVHLENVDFQSLELLLQCAYTGSVDVTAVNVQPLLVIANHLQVPLVKDSCEQFILKNTNEDNCVSSLLQAITFSMQKVKERCFALIARHLEDVSMSADFLTIPFNSLVAILEYEGLIVFRDGFPLPKRMNEIAVLEAALHYVTGQSKATKLNEEQMTSLARAVWQYHVDDEQWKEMLEMVHISKLTEKDLVTFRTVREKAMKQNVELKSLSRRDKKNTKVVKHRALYRGSIDSELVRNVKNFNDKSKVSMDERSRITEIQVYTTHFGPIADDYEHVTGLHVFYENQGPRPAKHGGNPKGAPEEECTTIKLGETEVIVQVIFGFIHHEMVQSITFVTSEGREIGPIGDESGCQGAHWCNGPPEEFGTYLHSIAGKMAQTYEAGQNGSFNVLLGLTFNWVCHRDIDDPNCIENKDYEWQQLGRRPLMVCVPRGMYPDSDE